MLKNKIDLKTQIRLKFVVASQNLMTTLIVIIDQ